MLALLIPAGILSTLGDVGQWIAAIFWVLLLIAAGLVILVGLPGGWVALGLAVIYDAIYGFSAIGWTRLIFFAVLLGVGEVIESFLGSVYVARKGASRWGVVGGFLGGVAGAILGSPVVPVLGTVVGAFVGTFGGAVLGEYYRLQRMEPSLRIGLHATIGKLLASFTKLGLALAGSIVAAIGAFSALTGSS